MEQLLKEFGIKINLLKYIKSDFDDILILNKK